MPTTSLAPSGATTIPQGLLERTWLRVVSAHRDSNNLPTNAVTPPAAATCYATTSAALAMYGTSFVAVAATQASYQKRRLGHGNTGQQQGKKAAKRSGTTHGHPISRLCCLVFPTRQAQAASIQEVGLSFSFIHRPTQNVKGAIIRNLTTRVNIYSENMPH